MAYSTSPSCSSRRAARCAATAAARVGSNDRQHPGHDVLHGGRRKTPVGSQLGAGLQLLLVVGAALLRGWGRQQQRALSPAESNPAKPGQITRCCDVGPMAYATSGVKRRGNARRTRQRRPGRSGATPRSLGRDDAVGEHRADRAFAEVEVGAERLRREERPGARPRCGSRSRSAQPRLERHDASR
jgi:hypothetical protein